MEQYNIYEDISQRTQGDIYIGVVGPVRTGKSTFIKRFMETLVLPNIQNDFKRERAVDELPQSAAGKTIMTTEPKFIPNEAVSIELGDGAKFNVRLIDCVGYIVPNSSGYLENGAPRMVHTPWFEDPIPFNNAAELGTKKVITEHSTVGLVVTCDGSFGELSREDFVSSEERVVNELKAIHKPFIVLLNSFEPASESTQALRRELEAKYNVPVMAVNCQTLDEKDIVAIMEALLFEFPIKEFCINLPGWVDALEDDNWLKSSIYDSIMESARKISAVREVRGAIQMMQENEYLDRAELMGIDLGTGYADAQLSLQEGLFYKILGELTGLEVKNEESLITMLSDFSEMKKEHDKISQALDDVYDKGYGIVIPSMEELKLEEPEIVKQGGRFGIRLKASAPSIHMIRADIETEVSPIVGSEKQSEELVNFMLQEFEEDPQKIWDTNIFGKSVHELVNEGMHSKLCKMPEDAQAKLQNTLQRIVNEGSGGLICIIL